MTLAINGGNTLSIVNETFTADVDTVATLAVAATERLVIRSFHLVVTGNSAVAPCQIKSAGGVIHLAFRFPIAGTSAVGSWQYNGPAIMLTKGESLLIGGGGAGGVLDGGINYIKITT